MKLAIMCKSLLLERALKLFLQPYIAPLKHCDFVICDHELKVDVPQFKIKTPDSKLAFPFSKSALLVAVEKFTHNLDIASEAAMVSVKENKPDFSVLEDKLNKICSQFNAQIIRTIKEHYEK